MKVMFGILCVSLMALPLLACDQPGKDYTMKNEPSGEYYDWKKTGKPERPWLLPYHQTLVTKIVLCVKNINAQPGKISAQKKKVYMTFEEALEVIRTLDNITIGIPNITYLVGWQFEGHDSKYPSWAEVDKDLKRPQDKTATESLRWLMREGLIDWEDGVEGDYPLLKEEWFTLLNDVNELQWEKENQGSIDIIYPAGNGGIKGVRIGIENGADVNAKGIVGWTPLHAAAGNGNKETAELLIAKGADVNAKMEDGDTPLDLAEDEPETADLLREHGGKTGEELKAEGK